MTSCCLNQTFYIHYYGFCGLGITNHIKEVKFSEQSECLNNNIMDNIGYYLSESCLLKANFYSMCFKPSRKISACMNLECEKVGIISWINAI